MLATTNTVPTEALRLNNLGLAVFPCRSDNKRPVTPRGHKDASCERAKVGEMFALFSALHKTTDTPAAAASLSRSLGARIHERIRFYKTILEEEAAK